MKDVKTLQKSLDFVALSIRKATHLRHRKMPNPPPKEDTWAFQPIGAPLLPSPVKCLGEKNMYVALWYKNGKPIHGRSWNNGGVVECSFPYEEAEWTTKAQLEGQIQVLQYVGDHNTQGFWYEWIKYKDRIEKIDDKHQLVRCGDSFPVFWKRPEGNLLGYVDNKTEDAWFSFNGKVIKQTGPQLNDMYIIIRNCVDGPPDCECAGCGGLPRKDVSSVERDEWMDMREGEGEYEGGKVSVEMQSKNGMATEEEIEELLISIGGFEKWPVLIEDCRREVVKNLDFRTRWNLRICSKDDHKTVETTNIRVESIEINDVFGVSVHIEFSTENAIQWFFSQHEQDTHVRWHQYNSNRDPIDKEVIWKSSDYYEESVKFAEKWMKKSKFELNEIKVRMANYPFDTSQIKSLPCCKKISIEANSVECFEWWLKKCPEQLDVVELHGPTLTLPSDFLNAPQIIQAASEIWLSCRVTISDDQLMKLRARIMYFESVDVSDKGINQFIKNWVNGNGVDDFEDVQFFSDAHRDLDVVFAGLDEVKEWDEEFKNEQREFAEDFKEFKQNLGDRCYQIESKVRPFESLTLSIHEDYLLGIYATGKRVENNGQASTHYELPSWI
ncbi:unnamed protein product [Caenorhabditis brenneri]